MIAEILQLVEITRKLATRKGELDKAYFENFIEPAWSAFVRIHEDYMTSLSEYADLVSQEDVPIETLIKKISQDSIYTRDMRMELHALLEHLPSARLKTKEKHLHDFELSMVRYFDDRSRLNVERTLQVGADQAEEVVDLSYDDHPQFIDTPYGHVQGIPFARFPLIVYLARKGDESNRAQAKELFNRVALNLQAKYKDTTENYYHLRKALLT